MHDYMESKGGKEEGDYQKVSQNYVNVGRRLGKGVELSKQQTCRSGKKVSEELCVHFRLILKIDYWLRINVHMDV